MNQKFSGLKKRQGQTLLEPSQRQPQFQAAHQATLQQPQDRRLLRLTFQTRAWGKSHAPIGTRLRREWQSTPKPTWNRTGPTPKPSLWHHHPTPIRPQSQEFVFPIPPCRGAELSGRLLLGRPAGRRNRLINEGFCSRASNTRKRKWQLHHELWFYVALHLRAYGNDHDHLCLRRKSAAQSSINSSVCHGLLGARYSRLRAFPPRLPRSRSRKHLASPAKATMRSSLSFMKWRDYLTE